MNTRRWRLVILLAVLALVLGVTTASVSAQFPPMPPPEEIENSIQMGLSWLASVQDADGGWDPGYCDRVARTGLVVLKFETRAIELGMDPLGPDYEYSGVVQAGLDYIMSQMTTDPVLPGDWDINGNGSRVYFTDCGGHVIYNTGVAMMALAASYHPEIYGTTLEDAVDLMSWAQADPVCGVHRGGWRYQTNVCDSDNSNSGYATLGLGFAAAPPPFGFGIAIPQPVLDELSIWIDVIQDDVNGDPNDGGSWYDPYNPWVNILKTGNLIYEMGLVGDMVVAPRLMDAVDYIERHWYDAGVCDTGWRDHRQAMFTMMKGLESMGISHLDLDGDSVPEHDWFAEVSQHLLDTQQPGGSWPWDCWGSEVLSTAWALLTLEKSVPTFEIPAPVDINPGSCPNPFNMKARGALPVAIAGTDELDVMTIDPASIRLLASDTFEGVAPLRWSYEDAAIPYEPYLGKEGRYDCVAYYGGDGYLDLVLHFDRQEVAAALGEVMKGDEIVVWLTGFLFEDAGGGPIIGEDVIWIR